MSAKPSLVRQFAVGAIPVALFLAMCGLTAVMETFGLIPAALALIAIGVATPVVILWAETGFTAAVAATLTGALIVAAIVMRSWFVLPATALLLFPAAAVTALARLRARPEGETWADTGLEVLAGFGAAAAAIAVIWAFDSTETGLLELVVLCLCLEGRRRAGPAPERA